MAAEDEFKHDLDQEDDEKQSLKVKSNTSLSKGYGSTSNNYTNLDNNFSNDKANKNDGGDISASPNNNNNGSAPSLTRRMSSQFVFQVERQRSVVDNMGITDRANQLLPDAITQHIPGLNRKSSQLKLTYFCNICFTKYPIDEGFTLRNCQHQFCPPCIQGFMENKISNGVVNLTCFYPMEGNKPCGEKIDEDDIHQCVSAEMWEKYEKFKANSENIYSRQCPFCDTTQNGDPEQPIMTCTNPACGKQFCLYHSNAHPPTMTCEEYELSTAKENKMNEMAIQEMGDNVKPCPQCKFRILKNGGCNHMKCVKCGCSFCWLCMQIIEDEELPMHYKVDGPCKGQQFAGMEGEPPPRWIMCILIICMIIFCIPSTILGIAFGIVCFPLVLCCDCRNDAGERQSLFETMFGCWLIWLIIFIVIAVLIPTIIFYIIWEVLKSIYGIFRICLPCLPACPTGNRRENQDIAGGGNNNNNNNNNNTNNNGTPTRNRNNYGLLSEQENDAQVMAGADNV